MSTFAVTVEQIARVWDHPNADRLAMAQLTSMTYQFVVLKDQFQAGDQVIYFPIDSLLPSELIQKLGLEGRLSGKEKNRVKTVRLRDQISQGIVAFPQVVMEGDVSHLRPGQDITTHLGVTKYEAPIVPSMYGNLVGLPALVSTYDIEGAERYISQVEQYLMDQPVLITEKLEGSHFAASILPDDSIAISQRNYRIQPIEGKLHDWHKVAANSGITAVLPQLKSELGGEVVTVRGEVIGPGIQKNVYNLKDHTVFAFEVEVNGQPVDADTFLEVVNEHQIPSVPVLAQGCTLRDWLGGRSVAEASNGKSVLADDLWREGIVIRPYAETRDESLGRVIIKQRSPEYLAHSDF